MTSHPVQYQAPLFQELARDPSIDLVVYYGHNGSVVGAFDAGFGMPVRWDRPLLTGYRSYVLADESRFRTLWGRFRSQLAIWSHLRQGRYDAVFIHSYATQLSLVAYVAAWCTRTPILLRTESHSLRRRPIAVDVAKRALLTILFRLTTAFLVIGVVNRRFFARYGVAPNRMFSMPYCVDNDYLSREADRLRPHRQRLRRELGLRDEVAVVVYSGKLIERKRVEDLFQAAALLSQRGIPVQLLVLGDGPLRASLEQLGGDLGVEAVFAGFQNQTQLARHYVCADVLVLPSSFEPWGLVINEAMVCQLPVVATAVTGASFDLIVEGITGWTYPSGDHAALANCLMPLVRDRAEAHSMGIAARARVSAYSYRACTAGILAAMANIAPRSDGEATRLADSAGPL